MRRLPALSILEILLVILIFSAGILVVLQSLLGNAALLAQSQIRLRAQHHAKELLESALHLRSSNLRRRIARDCLPTPGRRSDPSPTDTQICGQRLSDFADSTTVIIPQISGSRREFFTEPATNFSTISPASGDQIRGFLSVSPVITDGQPLPATELLKITATVQFARGTRTGSLTLETIFADEN